VASEGSTQTIDTGEVNKGSTPEETLGSAYVSVRAELGQQVLAAVMAGTPSFFETLVTPNEAAAAGKAQTERGMRNCADPRFTLYYTRTACLADKMTFEELADTSKISSEAKAIFPELRNVVDDVAREYVDLLRKYGGTVGAKRADLYVSTAKVQNDKNNLDLYNGLITWGEYNKRRQEIYREYQAAASAITS
jgi:hypothetical protein